MNAYKAIATRIVNAETNMVSTIAEIANLSHADAVAAFNTLRKVKAIKLDAVNGKYLVKHGAYMDAEVLVKAAKA